MDPNTEPKVMEGVCRSTSRPRALFMAIIAVMALTLAMVSPVPLSWAADSGSAGQAAKSGAAKGAGTLITNLKNSVGKTGGTTTGTTGTTAGSAASASGSATSTSSSAASASGSASVSASSPTVTTLQLDADGSVVLVDDDNCLITLSDFEGNAKDGFTVHIDAENRTSDTNLMFSIDDAAIDGWTCNPYWAQSATAGQKVSGTIEWYPNMFEGLDIDDITEVKLAMRVYDSDDFSADSLVDGIFVIHPSKEAAALTYTHKTDPSYTVLVDDDNCSIWAESYDEGDGTFSMTMFLQNKTDKTLEFSIVGAALDGWMCDPYWAMDVMPDTMALETVQWSGSIYDALDITKVTDVTLALKVYDYNDWSASDLVNDTFEIYPQGEKAATSIERKAQTSDVTLVDDDNCSFTFIGTGVDEYDEYNMEVCIENKTDSDLMFSIDDASLDGTMCDPYWATSVMAGKKALVPVSWTLSSLEDAGISADSVSDIKFTLQVYPTDDWSVGHILDEELEVKL